jgi:hypothetical protein
MRHPAVMIFDTSCTELSSLASLVRGLVRTHALVAVMPATTAVIQICYSAHELLLD